MIKFEEGDQDLGCSKLYFERRGLGNKGLVLGKKGLVFGKKGLVFGCFESGTVSLLSFGS